MSTGSGPPHCMLFGVYVVGFVLFGLVGLGCFFLGGGVFVFSFFGGGVCDNYFLRKIKQVYHLVLCMIYYIA